MCEDHGPKPHLLGTLTLASADIALTAATERFELDLPPSSAGATIPVIQLGPRVEAVLAPTPVQRWTTVNPDLHTPASVLRFEAGDPMEDGGLQVVAIPPDALPTGHVKLQVGWCTGGKPVRFTLG